MPIKNLESIAKKYDVSTKTAEKKWKEAEKIVKKEYDPDEESGKYYGTIMKILKAKLKKVNEVTINPVTQKAIDLANIAEKAKLKALLDKQKQLTISMKTGATPAKKDALKKVGNLINFLKQNITSKKITTMTGAEEVAFKSVESKTIDTPVVEDGEAAPTSQGTINTGSMSGSVTDQSGKSIPSVTGFPAAYFPSYWGMQKRSQKKKKRKRVKEAIEYVENYLNR